MTRIDSATANWRKSTHSQQQASECVEVAQIGPAVAVRDSKDPDGPVLLLGPHEWHALHQHIRSQA
jgi:hypothetical protein